MSTHTHANTLYTRADACTHTNTQHLIQLIHPASWTTGNMVNQPCKNTDKTKLTDRIIPFTRLIKTFHHRHGSLDIISGKKENNTWKLIKSQWCKRLHSIIGAINKLSSMITGTYGRFKLAWNKNRESGSHSETLKGQERLLETGDTFSKQGKHSPEREEWAVYDTHSDGRNAHWTRACSTSGHFPTSQQPLLPVWHHRPQGVKVKRAETVGCRPNYEQTEAEKGRGRQRKSVVAERELSDSFPWQDDKTVRNAVERGKRSDQEPENEKKGKK